jgi:hypothetical protein
MVEIEPDEAAGLIFYIGKENARIKSGVEFNLFYISPARPIRQRLR